MKIAKRRPKQEAIKEGGSKKKIRTEFQCYSVSI